MKGSAVRIRASALSIFRDFSLESRVEVTGTAVEGSTRGLRLAAARPVRIASLIVMRRRAASRDDHELVGRHSFRGANAAGEKVAFYP
jgi:hypothetical protein